MHRKNNCFLKLFFKIIAKAAKFEPQIAKNAIIHSNIDINGVVNDLEIYYLPIVQEYLVE
jgi:hypothetical protein